MENKNTSQLLTSLVSSTLLFLMVLPSWAWSQEVDTLKLLYHWNDTALEGSSQYDNTYNEIWGFVQNEIEYAVIGSTAGTHIFPLHEDLSNVQPIFIPGSSSGSHVIHRDYHDYRGYLYAVCDEGSSSTLQIIDLSQIEDTAVVIYDSDTLFSRSHNIFIDSSRAKMYVCSQKGGTLSYKPLGIYDISDPTRPQLINTYTEFGNESIGHVHDAFVYNDTAFLNCGFDGLRIVDFTQSSNPQLLASLTDYPFRGYNHSGWTNEERKYYYMGDETHGAPLKVLNISDISDPEVEVTFNAGNPHEFSIPHNQVVHCNYLYVPYYFDGLHVYDISQADSPVRSHVYPTSNEPHIRNYKGAWGVYPFLPSGRILVSDMQEGLFILEGPDCEFETKTDFVPTLSFKISPNPSTGYFRLDFPDLPGEALVQVIAMNGKVVFEQQMIFNENYIASSLNAGVYLIRAISESQYGQQLLIISP